MERRVLEASYRFRDGREEVKEALSTVQRELAMDSRLVVGDMAYVQVRPLWFCGWLRHVAENGLGLFQVCLELLQIQLECTHSRRVNRTKIPSSTACRAINHTATHGE